MDRHRTIYRLVTKLEWLEAQQTGFYNGAEHDKADGFIHFSTGDQVEETLSLHYAQKDDVLLVAVDVAKLGSALERPLNKSLVYELAPKRGDYFPHLYSELPLSAVMHVTTLSRDAQGKWVTPKGLDHTLLDASSL